MAYALKSALTRHIVRKAVKTKFTTAQIPVLHPSHEKLKVTVVDIVYRKSRTCHLS